MAYFIPPIQIQHTENNCLKMDVSRYVLVCSYIHFWGIILNYRNYYLLLEYIKYVYRIIF
jgi:hypothetical protein